MKILEANLNQFIESPKNTLDLTNSYITEVDDFTTFINSEHLVVGHVLEVKKHENADTLSVTKVNIGSSIEQIVCGASNIREGQYVITALPGAVLPGNFQIKKSKIRGVESNGMICSLGELGFNKETLSSEDQEGIYYFDEPKEVGSNPIEHLNLDGYLMTLDLTPNRSDLLSHLGYAKDLAAVLKTDITMPIFNIKEDNNLINEVKVKIDSKHTNSYYARYFSDVKIKSSPLWLIGFLNAMGVKPINNVVDVTNYILYTYGIPMHAFDALKFGSLEVVVKDNEKKQTVKTLDDQSINLTGDEILITNGKTPMAIGGVMGLDNSKVVNTTTEIILEVASFNKLNIRKTSKKLNLRSDSSLRFERGIDEEVMMDALNHATYLIQILGEAKVHKGISSDVKNTLKNSWIKINLDEIIKYIGHNIKHEEILEILNYLNYEIKALEENNYEVKAPSYRNDINIKADVLEEIIRLYGMDNIKNDSLIKTSSKGLTSRQKSIREIRTYLSNIGLNEVVTYSLLNKDEVKLYNDLGEVLSVLKPMSSERTAIRHSLINGLIKTYEYNKARNNEIINIFEIGNVYAKETEETKLAVLLNKQLFSHNLVKFDRKIDFYYLSALLENVMKLLNVNYHLEQAERDNLHPYQQADIIVNNEVVGFVAKLHPRNFVENVFVFELDLKVLNKKVPFKYEVISKYPSVKRDIAFIIKDDFSMLEITNVIRQTGSKTLTNVELFDIYQGVHIEPGFKSVAFSLTFNNKEKTLESSEVDKLVQKIIKRLEIVYEIRLRE